ncbi:hypothetical protein ACFVQ4_00095 [Streptomyces laurentii]|uniref:hypothetical protein n=1 Tax=Streptomyces laurentii TaxID=39478 RepID=UPI0036867549
MSPRRGPLTLIPASYDPDDVLWAMDSVTMESMVDKPQAGTEDFANLQEAPAAITRNRVL